MTNRGTSDERREVQIAIRVLEDTLRKQERKLSDLRTALHVLREMHAHGEEQRKVED